MICLVEVGALVSFRCFVHGTTKISAGGGGAPLRQEYTSYVRKVYQTKLPNSTRIDSPHALRAGEAKVDKNAPAKTLDRSRDSSDFNFAKV